MMKTKLIEYVKRSRFLYKVYSCVMSLVINFIKLFVKTDDKLIVFMSYGGRYFNDSPRFIYEHMLKDSRFAGYKLIWAFADPKKFDLKNSVKTDSLTYFRYLLKARCWVTNVVMERGINFKGKHTFYFHTTHGTLPKLSGNDVAKGIFGFDFHYRYDCSCAQSECEAQLQTTMFGLKIDQILLSGYPKNDALANCTCEMRNKIRNALNIPEDKTVILYAPTYREQGISQTNTPVDFSKWEEVLGEDYLVLYRAHPVNSEQMVINASDKFIRNMSFYPDNVDLMIASDILISDYSGIFFEFAVLNRPMYCFAYDYETYVAERGLYFDIRKILPGGDLTQEEILLSIKNGLTQDEKNKLADFREKYVKYYGNATAEAVNKIYDSIGN